MSEFLSKLYDYIRKAKICKPKMHYNVHVSLEACQNIVLDILIVNIPPTIITFGSVNVIWQHVLLPSHLVASHWMHIGGSFSTTLSYFFHLLYSKSSFHWPLRYTSNATATQNNIHTPSCLCGNRFEDQHTLTRTCKYAHIYVHTGTNSIMYSICTACKQCVSKYLYMQYCKYIFAVRFIKLDSLPLSVRSASRFQPQPPKNHFSWFNPKILWHDLNPIIVQRFGQ